MDCTTCQSLLVEYAYDELDASRREQVAAALERCPDCRAELAAIVATRSAFAEPEPIELSARRRADVLREARLAADRAGEAAAPWWSALLSPATLMAATLLIAGAASWWIVRGGADEPGQDVAAVATAEEAGADGEIDPHLRSTAEPEHLEEEAVDVPSIADALREQAAELAEAPSQGALWDEAPSAEPAPPARSGYLETERLTNAMPAPIEPTAVPTGLGVTGLGRSGGSPSLDEVQAMGGGGMRGEDAIIEGGAASQQQAAAAPVRRPAPEPAAPTQPSASPSTPSVGDGTSSRAGVERESRGVARNDDALMARNEDADRDELSDPSADFGEAAGAPAPGADAAAVAPLQQEVARTETSGTTGGLSGRSASGSAAAMPEAPSEPEEETAIAALDDAETAAAEDDARVDDPLQAGLAAYDAGDWARAATLLHAARTQPGVDVGTAVYYEAAALAALGDSAGALSVLEAFDGGLAGHLLAGEARRLRDTLQERARDATNREMLRDNLEFEPADAVQEAEPR